MGGGRAVERPHQGPEIAFLVVVARVLIERGHVPQPEIQIVETLIQIAIGIPRKGALEETLVEGFDVAVEPVVRAVDADLDVPDPPRRQPQRREHQAAEALAHLRRVLDHVVERELAQSRETPSRYEVVHVDLERRLLSELPETATSPLETQADLRQLDPIDGQIGGDVIPVRIGAQGRLRCLRQGDRDRDDDLGAEESGLKREVLRARCAVRVGVGPGVRRRTTVGGGEGVRRRAEVDEPAGVGPGFGGGWRPVDRRAGIAGLHVAVRRAGVEGGVIGAPRVRLAARRDADAVLRGGTGAEQAGEHRGGGAHGAVGEHLHGPSASSAACRASRRTRANSRYAARAISASGGGCSSTTCSARTPGRSR